MTTPGRILGLALFCACIWTAAWLLARMAMDAIMHGGML